MKDTNNLLSYNVWSGSEYDGSISGFSKTSNLTLIPSNEFSIIGECSIKGIRTADSSYYVDIQRLTTLSVGNTVTSTFKVYTSNTAVNVALFSGNQGDISFVTVYASNLVQEISVSGVVPTNSGYIATRIQAYEKNKPFYIDDISLTVS